ncbi:pyridoxal phosphate-dependent decarboxylase family protein [Paraflavitalea speifideaquila]|uniref:pyridoxal phosphate-dependent decarboxylase family protein n=1 Tax=Paraflavitalea speifideaquila TaxID=3076558 RepID=UPI0028E46FB5|nr:pyridoxal-dependent decarboxylase [Paraflavitalea speifideiaquila]
MIIYGSAETHNCVVKGVEVIGIGSDNFRKVPVDEQYRIRVDLLKQMIRADREAGHLPFCIVGNAGTVNTGAIDPLEELAAIAKEEQCWFHIDGAFGSVPKILPEFEDRLKGVELADSLSFDFHKWLYVNYEVACVLIRDATIHREAFAAAVNYLVQHERGLSGGPDSFSNYGMELSRGFKALKVWMSIKENGLHRYQYMIRKNLRQAQYLAGLVQAEPTLELLADVPLNIVCYRFNPGGLEDEELNIINKEILMRLQEQGIAAPSYTLLNGKYAIRAAITNHRSRMDDFDILVEETLRIGKELIA